MSDHTIVEEKTLNDGTVVYRCRDCGIGQTSREAFEIYACTPVSEVKNTAGEETT